MPAVSKKQQRFFGMVRAAQKGEMENPSPEVAKVAATAKRSDVKKFASTKHKGLPMKKEEFINEEDYDRMKDRQMERGTFRPRSKPGVARSGGSQPKPMPKKKYDGMSALDHVKAEIRKKHGKGAIMGEAKKDCVKADKKTMHNCAKKVCSEQWGVGECIYGQHAIPDAEGNVAWYDVMFEHGIEKGVDISTLEVLEEGSHGEHVEHQGEDLSEKKGLWANIHAKRKRGEKPAKKGDKDYPETLNVEGYGMGEVDKKVGAVTAIPKKEQDDARARILAKTAAKRKAKLAKEEVIAERGDFWHPDPEKDRKLGGPGANQRAREDRAAASKPKSDPKKLRPGESYMDYAKRMKTRKEDCWDGYEKKGMKTMFGKKYPNCVKKTKKEEVEVQEGMGDIAIKAIEKTNPPYLSKRSSIIRGIKSKQLDSYLKKVDKKKAERAAKKNEELEFAGELMTEEQFDEAAGEKDACYKKVKARYSVWPSAYASGALVKCRKVGADNWGNKSKK